MTRKEAKKELKELLDGFYIGSGEYELDIDCVLNYIDNIYNDFEDRTCINCKFKQYTPSGKYLCIHKNKITENSILEIYDDFGYNN